MDSPLSMGWISGGDALGLDGEARELVVSLARQGNDKHSESGLGFEVHPGPIAGLFSDRPATLVR